MAGKPWESDPIVQAGPSSTPARPPQNLRERKNLADINATGASAANAGASAAETQAGLPFVAAEKKADVAVKEAAAADARREQERKAKASKTGAFTLRESTDEMLSNIRNARRQTGGWATGWGSLLKGVPGTDALALKTALEPITANIMLGKMKELKEASLTGATGFGNQTEREGKALENSIRSLNQAQGEEDLAASLAAVEKHYRRFYAFTRGENPDEPKVAARYGLILPEAKPPSGPPPGDLTGTTEEVQVPELRGVNSTVANMLRSGITAGEIKEYLNEVQPTLGDRAKNLEWYEDYYRQNPGDTKLEPGIDIERYFKPKEGLARLVGEVAESPVGAAAIGAADTVTAGLLDEATSNPELTRSVMSAVQENNPGSYLTGQVLGGGAGGAGLALGLPKLGLKLAPATLAALEGGAYGFGSADSDSATDRLTGAGVGALMGAGGQKVLGGATKGAAALVGGAKNKAATLLDKYGVDMTLGEMMGGKLAALENKISQIPFAGGVVRARQQDSIESFNKAAFQQAVAPIGGSTGDLIGEQGINSAKRQIGDFYKNLLKGKSFVPDEDFVMNTSTLRDEIANLPNIGPTVSKEINKKVGDFFDPARALSGTEWQTALRDLKEIGSKYRSADLGPALRDGIDGLVVQFNDLATRQAPDIAEGLSKANSAYRHYSILKDAVRDLSHEDVGRGVFVPETLFQKSAMNAERYGGRGASAEGKHAFFDLADAGIDALTPARQRNRATPFLFSTGVGLGAGTLAHYLQGTKGKDGEVEGRDPALSAILGTGTALALSAPYSKLAQKYLQKALAGPRSPGMVAKGEAIRGKIAPWAGTPAIAPLVDLYHGNLPNTEYDPLDVEQYTRLPDGLENLSGGE